MNVSPSLSALDLTRAPLKNESGLEMPRDRPSEAESAAADFEGVFLSLVLKEMRSTLTEGLFGKEQSDSFGALFDMYMGQHLGEKGDLGIRNMVLEAYSQNQIHHDPATEGSHHAAK